MQSSLIPIFLIAALSGAAQDWSRFRGPNGTGVSGTTRVPEKLDLETNLLWKTPLPPGHSSPVISGESVFLTAFEGDKLWTYRLSLQDGQVKWRRDAPRPRQEKLDKLNSPASPTPVTDGRAVYVFFGDYGLLSYDFEGKERWRTPLGPFRNVYGMGASPVVAEDRLVLVADHGPESWIAAFGTQDGKQLWRTARPEALSGASTPVVWKGQVLAPGSFRMDAYDLATGHPVWWVQGLPSEMKATPDLTTVDGVELLFISGFNTPENDPGKQVPVPDLAEVLAKFDANHDGKIAKSETPDARTARYFPFVDLNGDGQLDAAEWKSYQSTMVAVNSIMAVKPGGKGDVTGQSVVWRYHRAVPQCPSPVVYEGLVYMLNDGGVLTVLDAKNGSEVRRGRLRGVAEPYYASPVAAGGRIWFASAKGVVTALEAGPVETVAGVLDLGEEITATPAFAAGRMLIRTSKGLYCFGEKRR
jgi:outer membrane protein assembly factor BamB